MIKLRKSYIFVLLLSLGFAVFSGGNYPYVIFYTVLLMGVFSLIYGKVIMKNIYIKMKFHKMESIVGDEIKTTLKIENYSIMPIPYLEILNSFLMENTYRYNGEVFSLNMNSNRLINRSVTINKRGVFSGGTTHVVIKDLFGLIKCKGEYKSNGLVKVYPRIYDLPNIYIKGTNYKNPIVKNSSMGRYNGDSLDSIRDIREYQIGDNVKKIHWKLTARQGKIFVKNYESEEEALVNIFVDMREKPYYLDNDGKVEELMIDFALSLIRNQLRKNIKPYVYLCNSEAKSEKIYGAMEYMMLKEYLLTHYSDGKQELEKFIQNGLTNIQRKSSLVIITSDLSQKNMEYFLALALSAYKVTIFYYENPKESKLKNFDTLVQRGIEFYSIMDLLHYKGN